MEQGQVDLIVERQKTPGKVAAQGLGQELLRAGQVAVVHEQELWLAKSQEMGTGQWAQALVMALVGRLVQAMMMTLT